MKEKIIQFLLFPIGVFVSVFLAVAIVMIFKQDPTAIIPWIFIIIVNLAALYFFASKANPKNFKEGLIIGLVWFSIIIILDITITSKIIGPDATISYLLSPKTWFSYLIIIFAPIDWGMKLLIGRLFNK